jgi:hypothetical protein
MSNEDCMSDEARERVISVLLEAMTPEALSARISALSDDDLIRFHTLLSDTEVVVNVPSLDALADELGRRGLPVSHS